MKTIVKKNRKQFRQGDILVDFGQPIPAKAKKVKGGRVVLAHGVATGNDHAIESHADAWKEGTETVGVTVKKRTLLNHPEHVPAIPIRTGAALVRRQSTYSREEIRAVMD